MLNLDLIVEYLLENNFTSSYEDALNMIQIMSEEWMYSILSENLTEDRSLLNFIMEMRKEDKVKGRGKTPLYVERVRKNITKSPEGKWTVNKKVDKTMTPEASSGRYRHGIGYAKEYLYPDQKPQPHGTGGSLRGVKKQRGKPYTSKKSPAVQAYERKKEREAEMRANPKMSEYALKYFGRRV